MSIADGIDILHQIIQRKFDATYNLSFSEEWEHILVY